MNYQIEDVVEGRCTMDQVGTPKPEDSSDTPSLDLQSALQAAYKKMGSEKAFVEWAKKNPNLVYPMIAKLGIAQVAKTSPPALPNLEELTDEDIATLSSDDLKRIFLKGTLGITKKSELDALKD